MLYVIAIIFFVGLVVVLIGQAAWTGWQYGLQFRRHTQEVAKENRRARLEAKAAKKARR